MIRWTTFLLFLTGCNLISDLTNPLVGLGIVLDVDRLGAPNTDLSGLSGFDEGLGAQVFLADATEVNDLDNALVTGATVTLEQEPLTESASGSYTLASSNLTYDEGAEWDVSAQVGSDTAKARLTLPPAPDYSLPASHSTGSELTLDLSGQGFDSLLVVVIDDSGSLTYSNQPQTAREIYNFTHGSTNTNTFSIPGSAFAQNGAYAVGVGGMNTTSSGDLDGMNSILSSFVSGVLVFKPMVVGG